MVQYEGIKDFKGEANETKQPFIDIEIEDYNNSNNYPNQYLIEFSKVNSIQIIIILND